MKMERKYYISIIILILITGIFIYTHFSSDFFHNNKQQRIAVTTQPVIQKTVTAYLEAIGNVEAYATVNVKSLVDGQIIKVGFTQGQVVQPNQLLYVIDPRPYQIALQQAQANLAKDQAQLTNLQLNLQRYRKLIKKGYVAPQDYDAARANTEAAAATVKADAAAVANAQLQLSYTNITAPINGRTGAILLKAGNLVKSADDATLVTINQINPIYISFTVPQQYLAAIQQQQALAPLSVLAHTGKNNSIAKGQLTFINNTIDTTTDTVQLKATFTNSDQLLWPGQFIKISLPSAILKNALIIPTSAIQTGQKGNYVFVVRNDGNAYYQTIVPGAVVKEGTVIEQGLQAGDQVVIDGQFLLNNGDAVKVVKP